MTVEEAQTDAPGPEEWEDLLGTGTVLRQVVETGRRPNENEDDGVNLEAPRKFFALIDVEIRLQDLFPGAHLVIPLMELDETSRFKFDAKFAYGQKGDPIRQIPPNANLECWVRLRLRAPYDEFLEQLTVAERHRLAERKRERGKFWFLREDYELAISLFQSMADLCKETDTAPEVASDNLSRRLNQVEVS